MEKLMGEIYSGQNHARRKGAMGMMVGFTGSFATTVVSSDDGNGSSGSFDDGVQNSSFDDGVQHSSFDDGVQNSSFGWMMMVRVVAHSSGFEYGGGDEIMAAADDDSSFGDGDAGLNGSVIKAAVTSRSFDDDDECLDSSFDGDGPVINSFDGNGDSTSAVVSMMMRITW
ncbi:hypothetical protein L1987_14029 [Smallanthus sonchifolius]|uniref:Uncharacterized protein n=1 Tax=Smallanthus sonchifolius TaxID=185202 RepID=A0ACB9JKD5_9ASTR|nr:hypothetical protein L1987_14029 [Smallanthus sonchifolius]